MLERSSFNKLVGTALGNYRLDRLIERNKMGPIFVAGAPPAKTMYLLRILDIPASLTAENRLIYLGRFQQEASKVAALQHPSILPLLDYGNQQGTPYLVSPYNAAMQSLHAYLAQSKLLDPLTASRYLDQIAAALEYAHQHAILHRNLTTNSILIDSSPASPSSPPRLAVADFGVMRMLELAQSLAGDSPQGYLTYGSSEASSPEQLLGKPVDTSTDIYALGSVLYRLLTGQRVFSGNTQDEVIQQNLNAPVPPLSKWRSDLPPGLDSIIARAMAKEPRQRFHRPIELADAFHQIVAPRDTARPPLAVPAPVVTPQFVSPPPAPAVIRKQPQQVSRRRAIVLIVAGGGVAAAAVTAVALFGSHFSSGTSTATTTNTPVTNSSSSTPTTASSTQATTAPAHTGTVIAHTTDVPVNGSKTFPLSGHNNPGVLVHLSNNNFVAFDSTCTHAGCAVSYNPQDKLLECPCHGATFDPAKNAAVVNGPATTPLAPVSITVNGDGTITTTS